MSTLPAFPAPLIGRQAELTTIGALMSRHRLVTLVGPGGCGKTQLALHLAGEWRTTFADAAVWIVELAPLCEPALLADLVRDAVGVEENASQPAMDLLVTTLRERRFLLILDNCEHLIHASACFVESLLQSCPQGHILATSREALKSAYEITWPVPPLALPEPGSRLSPEQAREYGAIALFVQRACATVPAFSLTAGNAALVTQICRRLDGLPLAIELAAGCLKMLSLAQIAATLETDLQILAAGHRTAPARQQTLQATMEWSYRLLTRDEQALFRLLCVVAGDFSVSLVKAVAAGACERAPQTLLRLIETSLVQVVPGGGEAEAEAEARYRLLETVRQYGRQQVQRVLEDSEAHGEEPEEDGTMRRYGAWCMALVRACPAEWDDGYRLWLDRMEIELDHLRACLTWIYAQHQGEQGLCLATALVGFWRQRGRISEGCRWLETGLSQEHVTVTVAPRVRAEALNALGVLHMWQGAYREAQTAHEAALAIWREEGDRCGQAVTHFRLGFLAEKQGVYTVARAHLVRSLWLFWRLGDLWGMNLARNRLGVASLNQGNYTRAERYLAQSVRFLRACHHTGGVASTLLNLGALALAQGDTQRAMTVLQESLALNETLRDVHAIAYTHLLLGSAASQEQAMSEAERQFRACLRLVTPESSPELLFRLFNGLGVVAAGRGKTLDAARLWGAMAALRDSRGLRYLPEFEGQRYEQAVTATRARLDRMHTGMDDEAFDVAWAEGQRLSLDEVFRQMASPDWLAQDEDEDEDEQRRPMGRPGVPHQNAPSGEEGVPRLRITSLGQVSVYRGDHLVTAAELPYAKARELLFYLLSHRARSKEQIGLALWPDATPTHLHSSFRVILYHLRRALGGAAWIVRDGQLYRFNRSLAYWYDVEAFEAALTDAERHLASAPKRALALLEEAESLYHGDFLEEMAAAEWLMERQEELRRWHLTALLRLGQLYLARHEVRRAQDIYRRAVASDKYCEAAHRGIIVCYVRMQEYSQAVHYGTQVRDTFKHELGIGLAPETLNVLHSGAMAQLTGARGPHTP